jgi:hypothetical protein
MRTKLLGRFPDLDPSFVDYLFATGSICDWLVPFEELDMGQVGVVQAVGSGSWLWQGIGLGNDKRQGR